MAVHALVVSVEIVAEGFFVEILDAALFDLQTVPYLVVGLYQAIGQIWVKQVFHYLPVKRAVISPSAVFKNSYLHCDI